MPRSAPDLYYTREPKVVSFAEEGSGHAYDLVFGDGRTERVVVGTKCYVQGMCKAAMLRSGRQRVTVSRVANAGYQSAGDMRRYGVGPGELRAIERPGGMGSYQGVGAVIRWARPSTAPSL